MTFKECPRPPRTVEIIGIRNDAFHEPIPSHQQNILWENVVSHLYIFEHQQVNIYVLVIDAAAFHTTIKDESLWDLKLCEMQVLDI